MSKKCCFEGQTYDILLRMCYNVTEPSLKDHPKPGCTLAPSAPTKHQGTDRLNPMELRPKNPDPSSAGRAPSSRGREPAPSDRAQSSLPQRPQDSPATRHQPTATNQLSFPKLNSELVPMTQNQLIAKTMTTKASPVLVLSSALWVCLILAIMGSILSLALWWVILRRKTRDNSNSGEAVPELKPLQRTEPPVQFHPPPSERNGQAETFQRAADPPFTCHQLHLGAQMSSKWEDHLAGCRGPTRYGEKEGGGGLPACSSVADHRIPLPATELGDTVLVTTKTV